MALKIKTRVDTDTSELRGEVFTNDYTSLTGPEDGERLRRWMVARESERRVVRRPRFPKRVWREMLSPLLYSFVQPPPLSPRDLRPGTRLTSAPIKEVRHQEMLAGGEGSDKTA